MYKFEKLEVWNDSVKLIKHMYQFCGTLPKSEEYVMVSQLKRAALSISLNIAEGTGSDTDVEFKRYLQIAKKSLFETVALLKIVEDVYHVDTKEYIDEITIIAKKLTKLIKYLQIKNNPKTIDYSP
jgi:four helix bundle protein